MKDSAKIRNISANADKLVHSNAFAAVSLVSQNARSVRTGVRVVKSANALAQGMTKATEAYVETIQDITTKKPKEEPAVTPSKPSRYQKAAELVSTQPAGNNAAYAGAKADGKSLVQGSEDYQDYLEDLAHDDKRPVVNGDSDVIDPFRKRTKKSRDKYGDIKDESKTGDPIVAETAKKDALAPAEAADEREAELASGNFEKQRFIRRSSVEREFKKQGADYKRAVENTTPEDDNKALKKVQRTVKTGRDSQLIDELIAEDGNEVLDSDGARQINSERIKSRTSHATAKRFDKALELNAPDPETQKEQQQEESAGYQNF